MHRQGLLMHRSCLEATPQTMVLPKDQDLPYFTKCGVQHYAMLGSRWRQSTAALPAQVNTSRLDNAVKGAPGIALHRQLCPHTPERGNRIHA